MRYIIFTLLTALSFNSVAQRALRYSEVQFIVGTMNYNGEVSTALDPNTIMREMGPYFAVDYNYFFGSRFGLGLRTGYGRIRSDDANHTMPERGLSFTSDVVEINGQMTFHLRRFGRQFINNKSAIYLKLSGGASFVHTQYPDDIQFPASTEIYPGTNGGFNLGIGGGVKWRLTRNSTFSVELMGHYLYSDLIEGFKLPNSSDASDGYGGLRIGYAILIL